MVEHRAADLQMSIETIRGCSAEPAGDFRISPTRNAGSRMKSARGRNLRSRRRSQHCRFIHRQQRPDLSCGERQPIGTRGAFRNPCTVSWQTPGSAEMAASRSCSVSPKFFSAEMILRMRQSAPPAPPAPAVDHSFHDREPSKRPSTRNAANERHTAGHDPDQTL
jgi:hypothetical protein